MQFDQRGSNLRAGGDLRLVGIDEEADLDPRGAQGVDARTNPVEVTRDVEPALGRDLLTAFGHHANVLGPQFEGEGRHLRRAGHLEVQPSGDAFAQPKNVTFLDMAPVLAQMDGDAISPGKFSRDGESHGIRLHRSARRRGRVAIAGLAHGGAMVDVNAEQDHRRRERKTEAPAPRKRDAEFPFAGGTFPRWLRGCPLPRRSAKACC